MIGRTSMLAAIGAVLVSACANGPAGKTGTMAGTPAESSFGELPAQTLNQGQCALVLWSRKSPPLRFLMTLNEPAVARVQIQGKMVELARVAQTGQPIYGQFPNQRYRGEGLSLSVTFSSDNMGPLNSGAVVSSAVVEYSDAQGWTAIVPAAGLIACQS